MSLTTTFTLPFRKANTKSLTLDPCFKVLYENNKETLTHFVTTLSPLPLKTIVSNGTFVGYLSTKEPGPLVEYNNMRTAIGAMRKIMMTTPHGVKMINFYKELLRLQGHWLLALAEQCAFHTYVKLTQALLIDRNDEALLKSVSKTIPETASKLCTTGFISRNQFTDLVMTEQSRLRFKCHEASEKLYDFKTSKDFWNQHTKLVAMIEHCENKLREIRKRSAKRKQQRIARARAAVEENSDSIHCQMGTVGEFPQPPHITAAYDNWMEETRLKYFNFNDNMEADGITFDAAEQYNDITQLNAAGVVQPQTQP
ncbi:hypothetical protein PV08_11765 [Exophiala spinifera]|uniref:Uncharacterized protein n=1 Tax=Exophiala spinifera TaxID=91928 RepID=A0A0D2BF90_9EURO|nr:uncharacterized protein PV08_11765 [Exophiala spinifera]KIW09989.1 hypothetical protein PV08_11765 [Exophiala spinifera]